MYFVSDKKFVSIVIAGAGGFGLEVYDYLRGTGFVIDGFIDDTIGISSPYGMDVNVLGPIKEYQPKDSQAVIVAIGSVLGRKSVLMSLWEKGCNTPALLSPGSIVSSSSVIGKGVVICPFAVVSRNAEVSDGVVVNIHCSVGHGAAVGKYSVLSPYSALNGDAKIGEECFLGTRSTIFPRVCLGNNCVVDSHSYAKLSVDDNKIITNRGNYMVLDNRIKKK